MHKLVINLDAWEYPPIITIIEKVRGNAILIFFINSCLMSVYLNPHLFGTIDVVELFRSQNAT